MIILFAISIGMLIAFWGLTFLIEVDYFYLPVAISLVSLLSLVNFRSMYITRAKKLIAKSKSMHGVHSLDSEEEEFFLSAASVILPRFYSGSQMPANEQSLLMLGNFLFILVALFYGYYVAAAVSVLVLAFLLRSFSFFGRNEKNNIRMACLQYFKATGRKTFSDADMQRAAMLYEKVIDFTEAVTMNVGTKP